MVSRLAAITATAVAAWYRPIAWQASIQAGRLMPSCWRSPSSAREGRDDRGSPWRAGPTPEDRRRARRNGQAAHGSTSREARAKAAKLAAMGWLLEGGLNLGTQIGVGRCHSIPHAS